jgi:hypothetical protein
MLFLIQSIDKKLSPVKRFDHSTDVRRNPYGTKKQWGPDRLVLLAMAFCPVKNITVVLLW